MTSTGPTPGYITTVRPEVPEAYRRPYYPQAVVLVAWGADPALASAALARGRAAAAGRTVRHAVASYSPRMHTGVLCELARKTAKDYEIVPDAAWWLVPHSAVSPVELDRARAALRQLLAADAAFADAFEREHGYALADVVRMREYPFAEPLTGRALGRGHDSPRGLPRGSGG